MSEDTTFVHNEEYLRDVLAGKTNNLNQLSKRIFQTNIAAGWWTEEDLIELERSQSVGNRYSREVATLIASKIALIHSEYSEGLEGMRKGLMDEHLPERPSIEVEFADAIIRTLDLAGFLGLDIGGAFREKIEYNAKRLDHKKEVRAAAGGKTI